MIKLKGLIRIHFFALEINFLDKNAFKLLAGLFCSNSIRKYVTERGRETTFLEINGYKMDLNFNIYYMPPFMQLIPIQKMYFS